MGRSRNRTRARRPHVTKALPPSTTGAYNLSAPNARGLTDLLATLNQVNLGVADPMPRDPRDRNPFAGLVPLLPSPIDQTRTDTGRAEPRILEYPVGWNLPGNDYREVPWSILRQAAQTVDIMRRCIEVRKRHIRGLKWAWTVSEDAIADAYRADPKYGRDDIEARLRDKWYPQIARLTEFWSKPWRSNGLTMGAWINGVMEEFLVLDAVAIYPRTTYRGEVIDLEILDGTTVKPLVDWRGARPLPPHPAYQQVLYGFPRGEFTATTEVTEDGSEVIPNAYLADQLYYHRENWRASSIYGYSPVEQALIAARLYLKRQGWMLSEYDDGSTPLTWLVPETADATELDPRQRTEWERAINDDLGGQTAARHRIKLSYPGFKPEQMASVDERYKPDYDLYLIKLVASHLGVPIAELGFTEAKGLGNSGFHEGQEDVMDRVGRRPDSEMLAEIIEDISRRFLDAPPELSFNFLGLESEDEAAEDTVADTRVRSARITLNEDRKRLGKPLYDFPEADMPMFMTQRGVVFLEGASQLAQPGELVAPVQAPPMTGPPEGEDANPLGPDGVQDDSDDTDSANEPSPTPKPGAPDKNSQPPAAKGKPGTKQQAAKAADPTKAVTDSDSTRQRVHDQLAEDYPEDSMAWLKSAVWSGPESVPTSDIDYGDEEDWRASHEGAKVDKFAGKIQQGKLKPIILVNTPDERKYVVIDGHHRALAYRKLGIPAMAYIGRVAEKVGPWDEMHSSQRGGGSGTETAKAAASEEEIRAEVAAYRNWARKHPNPSRPFRFEHPEAEQLAKAGGEPGKAQGPVKNWPGWERDRETASKAATRLSDALAAAVDTRRIAEQWGAARGLAKAARKKPSAGDAKVWLATAGLGAVVTMVLTKALEDIYREGLVIGSRSALAVVGGISIDWSQWTPGDQEAADLILGQDGLGAGLQQLLDQAGITIKSMGDNRLDALAQALADALANGDSVGTLAGVLQGILADPSWADMVATTELNRAVSAATLQQYQANGLEAKVWMTADDGRVCAYCQENEDDGPLPLDAVFASGESAPPGHPRCRCALGPGSLSAVATTSGGISE